MTKEREPTHPHENSKQYTNGIKSVNFVLTVYWSIHLLIKF